MVGGIAGVSQLDVEVMGTHLDVGTQLEEGGIAGMSQLNVRSLGDGA